MRKNDGNINWLKKMVLYAFLITKNKNFGVEIILKSKNTFIKKKITRIIFFIRK